MQWYEALILGIVQGLTEFLPISSSGHLVLASYVLKIENSLGFDVAVHVGTLFSVLVFYRKKIASLFVPPFDTIKKLIVATLPAAFAMLFFKNAIEKTFTIAFLPIGFLVSAIILFATDFLSGEKPFSYKSAISAGLFQSLALFSGISRSGSTIFGSRLFRVKKDAAVDFSFFMSVPVIAGSGVAMLFDKTLSLEPLPCVIGGATSFIFGLLAIKLTLFAVKKARLKFFAAYLFALAVCITIYNLTR